MPNWGRASVHTQARAQGDPIQGEQYSCAPLQWLGPVDPQATPWLFYLRNPNGGLLAGDQHQIQVRVGAGTHLEIRSQSATRLHPGMTAQTLEVYLEADSSLIWIPHPLIPGRDSDFSQQVTIRMEPGSRLAFGDLWTAGRVGMGEVWQFTRLQNQIRIGGADHLWWTERHTLDPSACRWLPSPAILGDYPCWGSLYLFGDWGQIPWADSETQWRLHRPQGQILRCVGHHSLDMWQHFHSLPGRLRSP